MADKSKEAEYQLVPEGAGEQLNRRDLIFLQCDRINKIISMPAFTASDARIRCDVFVNALDCLEAMLMPNLEDSKLRETIQKIHSSTLDDIQKITRGMMQPEDSVEVIAAMFIRAKQRYKALWIMIRDAGLLPEEDVTYEEI